MLEHQEAPHDRFLRIDNRLYLSGASLNGIGKKLSLLVEIGDTQLVEQITGLLSVQWHNGSTISEK